MTIEKKINTSIVIFLGLIVLTVAFVICPLIEEIKNSSQELVSEKNNFSVLDEQIASLERFKILYKNLEEILKKIDKLFINLEVPVEFIGFLEKTAANSSVNIEISPLPVTKDETDAWSSLNFQIAANGSFPHLLLFIEKLESSPYLIEIQSLTISQLTGEKIPAGNINALFSFKVFAE